MCGDTGAGERGAEAVAPLTRDERERERAGSKSPAYPATPTGGEQRARGQDVERRLLWLRPPPRRPAQAAAAGSPACPASGPPAQGATRHPHARFHPPRHAPASPRGWRGRRPAAPAPLLRRRPLSGESPSVAARARAGHAGQGRVAFPFLAHRPTAGRGRLPSSLHPSLCVAQAQAMPSRAVAVRILRAPPPLIAPAASLLPLGKKRHSTIKKNTHRCRAHSRRPGGRRLDRGGRVGTGPTGSPWDDAGRGRPAGGQGAAGGGPGGGGGGGGAHVGFRVCEERVEDGAPSSRCALAHTPGQIGE